MNEVSAGISALGVRDEVHRGGWAPAPCGGEVEAGGLAAERRGVGVEDVGARKGDAVVDVDVVGGAVHTARIRVGC